MRIAMAVEGTRGDVHPMLALGDAFAARGHQVVVCATPDFESEVRARGLEFRGVGHSVRDFLTDQAAALAGGGIAAAREAARFMQSSMESQFQTLPRATQGADLILGAGVQIAGASAAELHGVPYRYVMYCPGVLPSQEHPPMGVPVQTLPCWLNRLGWWLGIAGLDLVVRGAFNRQRRRLGLGPVRHVYRHVASERPVMAAEVELAPLPADCPFEVERISCLHPLKGEPLPAKLETFLESGPAPVYLGFGSMTDPDPAATTRTVLKAVAAVGCRAILSHGWAGLGTGPLPEGVFATGAVSHATLFPRLAAAVHHGGAGTTTAAARAGIPQIIVPHIADQFYWGRRVESLGVAPPVIARRRFSAEGLAASLSATLDNEFLRQRAGELARRLSHRSPAELDPTRPFLPAAPAPTRSL